MTCPLVTTVPDLISGSCSSPRALGLDFPQTPPHDDAPGSGPGQALDLLLAFGSANNWHEVSQPPFSLTTGHTDPVPRRFG